MHYYATTHQRGLIGDLLRKAELAATSLALVHKPVFQAANVWHDCDLGRPMDVVLGELSGGQASRLIDALKRHLDDQ